MSRSKPSRHTRCLFKSRPFRKALEDCTLLSNGPWLRKLSGLPGDTRHEQIMAAKNLLHNAQPEDAAHNVRGPSTKHPALARALPTRSRPLQWSGG